MTNKYLIYSLFHGIIFVCKSTCPVSNLNPLEALLRWEGPWVLRYSCQGCSTADSRENIIEQKKGNINKEIKKNKYINYEYIKIHIKMQKI